MALWGSRNWEFVVSFCKCLGVEWVKEAPGCSRRALVPHCSTQSLRRHLRFMSVPIFRCALYSQTVTLHAFLLHLIEFSMLLSLTHILSHFFTLSPFLIRICVPKSLFVFLCARVCALVFVHMIVFPLVHEFLFVYISLQFFKFRYPWNPLYCETVMVHSFQRVLILISMFLSLSLFLILCFCVPFSFFLLCASLLGFVCAHVHICVYSGPL